MATRPASIAILEPGYGPLFDRLLDVLGADERVRAVWLGGSIGRGDADAMSDLDVLVAVADGSLDDFAAGWQGWLAAITPTVIARPLPFLPGSLYAVTPGRERLDVVVEPVSALATTGFRHRLVVLDRDGLDAVVPPVEVGRGPSPARIEALVEEFFRDTGMFPVVVEREDWLLGLEAIHLVRTLLHQLFVEANEPLAPRGIKRWSERLTADQRAVLESLPGAAAERGQVLAAHHEAAAAFVVHARRIVADLGAAWPVELEEATAAYLRRHGLPPAAP